MDEIEIIPSNLIESKIFPIRGKRVMLDKDLAVLYGVTTGNLNKAVKRNLDRFPEDFMFQLSFQELKDLIFQFGISSWGGTRKLPFAFTENGVAMLSGVLNSKRAIQVNIQIMRTFTRLREILDSHEDLKQKLSQIERKYDAQFKVVFDAIRELMTPPKPPVGPRKKIGFNLKEPKAGYRSSLSPSTGEGRGGSETRKNQSARMKKTQSHPASAKKT